MGSFGAANCRVIALACIRGHQIPLEKLKLSNGKCGFCRGLRFNVTIERTVIVEDGNTPPSAEDLYLGLGAALLTGATPHLHRGSAGGVQESEYQLPDVDGKELVLIMEQTPEQILEWIRKIRLAYAKANLKPDQKLCATCGSIFTPPKYGPNRDDYCSPHCRGEMKAPGSAAPVPAKIPVTCPHCRLQFEIRGLMRDKLVRCPSCSGKFIATSREE